MTGPPGAGVVAIGPKGTELPQAVPTGMEGRLATADWLAALDAAWLGDAIPGVNPALAAAKVELGTEGPQPVRPATTIVMTNQRPTDRMVAAYIGVSTSPVLRWPA